MRVHDTGHRWDRGDHVALRLVGAGRGHVWARPAVVVRDDEAFVALYLPVGTPIARIQLAEGGRTEPPLTNEMDLLRVMRPGAEHSVCLFFDAGRGKPPYWEWLASEGRFRGWKIDIEAPFRRTSIGFDTTDNSLDVAVTPDRRWQWKDVEITQSFREERIFSAEEIDRFYAEGRRAIAALERGDPPFTEEWTSWEPDPTWTEPALPDDWPTVPGAGTNLNHGHEWWWRWPE